MGKIKLGRVRKYSHRKYSKLTTTTETPVQKKPIFSTMPLHFQFSLRDVPHAVLNQSSVHNFTYVFNILSKDKTLKNNWNLIKHSELFLMLCCFTTETELQPVANKTIIVNTDFTWNVIVKNKVINTTVSGIPHKLDMASFITLLEVVDESDVCPGIVDEDLKQLSISGGRQGVFRDRHGEIKARLDEDDSMQYIQCQGIVKSKAICEPCQVYKKTLQTMLSNTRNVSDHQSQSKTMVGSHCPWKHLSDQEKAERIRNCREERHQMARKVKRLEEKVKEVSKIFVFLQKTIALHDNMYINHTVK